MTILFCCRCGQQNRTSHAACLNCRMERHSWDGHSEQEVQQCRVCGVKRETRRKRSDGPKRWYRFYWFDGGVPTKVAPPCEVPRAE